MNALAALFPMVVDTVLKATLLLALGWAASFALRRRSAALRHMLRIFVLGGLLLLPFSRWLMPAWELNVIPDFAPKSLQQTTDSTAVPVQPAVSVRAEQVKPSREITRSSRASQRASRSQTKQQTANSALAAPQSFSRQNTPETTSSREPQTGPAWNVNWQALAFIVWVAGALVCFERWMASRSRVKALVSSAALVSDAGWNAQVRAMARAFGISRHVALLASRDTDVALTSGILYPSIVLPPDCFEWSPLRREAILHHELAHITRLDSLTQVLGSVAGIVYWFHPLVWATLAAVRNERERACDDYVLVAGTKASDYAHELLEIVSGLKHPEVAAALAMARRSQLEGRVLAVLNPALPRGSVSRKLAIGIAAITLGVVLPLAAMRPAQQSNSSGATSDKNKPSPASTQNGGNIIMPGGPQQGVSGGTTGGVQNGVPAGVQSGVPGGVPGGISGPMTAHRSENDDVAEPPEVPEVPDAPEIPETPQSQDAAPVVAAPAVPSVPAVPATPAVPAVPSVPAVPAVPPTPGGELSVCGSHTKLHNMSMNSNNGHKSWTANWSGDDCSVDLRADGEITFNADATEIQSISSGGYFEVNVREGSSLRQVRVTPSGNGLQYAATINGKQQPFEGEIKNWFSSFLLSLERSTGMMAESRVPRLLAKGGPNAVLDEIGNLQADYARGRYFRVLLQQPNLPSPVVVRVINQAGQQIGSDYELARILMEVCKQYDLADETSRTALLNATNKLKSDYEHARVLIELLKRPNVSSENVRAALNSASAMSSDYEKSRVLLALLDQKTFEQAYLATYLKAVFSINSDYEKSRDLIAAMQKYDLNSSTVNQILDAAASIQSDYEKSRLLVGLAGKGKFDEGQMGSYLKVVDSMKSDYERSRSLMALMSNNNLSAASVSKALAAISRASSDYEKSRVLTALANTKFDENQMGTYLSVVDSMKSDYERSRSLITLMDRNKLSNAALAKALDEAGRIGGDYEKARVLVELAHRYPLDGAMRDTYIKYAQSISSEYERNRALAAVVRRASL